MTGLNIGPRTFGLSGILDSIDRVEGLFLISPNKAKTAGEVSIGSPLKHVEGEFGAPEEIDAAEAVYWYWKRALRVVTMLTTK